MRLVIDFSVVSHQSWHQLFTQNFEPQYHNTGVDEKNRPIMVQWTELEEFSRKLAMNIFYLVKRFKADDVIFCLDAPTNWRASYVKEWYHSRLKVIEQIEGVKKKTYFVTFDKVEWKIQYVEQTDTWNVAKTKKAEKIDFSTVEHIVHDYEAIKDTQVFKEVIAGKPLIPYYKDTRKNTNWKAVTPKSEFKTRLAELGQQLADQVGARAIMVDDTEGDDVVAMAVKDSLAFDPNESCVVVSVDQDLYQLAIKHPNFVYYNPTKREEIPLKSDVASLKLLHKITGGDGSDNIKGISIGDKAMPEVNYNKDGAVSSGKGTVNYIDTILNPLLTQGLSGSKLFAPAYRALEADSDIETYNRNMRLVYLENIPKAKQDLILGKILKQKPNECTTTWSDFGMSGKDKIMVMNEINNLNLDQ